MKKAIISLAFAAAMAFGASAQTATVPNWYSYQGICNEKGTTVTVAFYIVQGVNETPVYAEQHLGVNTNAAGAFTVQLGLGTPVAVDNYETYTDLNDIDWTADNYKLETYVNGTLLGSAELGAVPYATVAGRALGIDGFDGDLAATIDALQQRDETLYNRIEEINIYGITPLTNHIADLLEQVDANTEAVDNATSDIQGIQETLRGKANVTDVTELQDQMEIVSSDLQGAVESLRGKANVTDVTELQDQMEIVSSDLQGAVESLRGKANVADVEALWEGLDNTQTDVMNLVEGNTQIKGEIASLKEAVAALTPGEVDFTSIQEQIDALDEAVEIATSDIQGIQEKLRNMANAADVVELQDQMEIVSGDVQGIQETLRGKANVTDVVELQDQMEIVSGDVQGIQETLRGKANVTDVVELQDQMEIVSGDVQGIQEKLRNMANAGDVVDLQSNVEELLQMIDQNMADVTEMVNSLDNHINAVEAEVTTNAEGLAIAQEDIMNLSTGNKENKSAIADLQSNVSELLQMIDQNMESTTTMINSITNRLDDMDTEIATNVSGLEVAEQTLIELTEQVKTNTTGVINNDALVQQCLNEIVNLKRLIQTQGEAIADLQLQILAQ